MLSVWIRLCVVFLTGCSVRIFSIEAIRTPPFSSTPTALLPTWSLATPWSGRADLQQTKSHALEPNERRGDRDSLHDAVPRRGRLETAEDEENREHGRRSSGKRRQRAPARIGAEAQSENGRRRDRRREDRRGEEVVRRVLPRDLARLDPSLALLGQARAVVAKQSERDHPEAAERDERNARDGAAPDPAVQSEGEGDDQHPARDKARDHQPRMLGAPGCEGADVLAAGAVVVLCEPGGDPRRG